MSLVFGPLFPDLVDSERRHTTNWISPQQPPVAAEWYNLLCSQIITNEQEQVVLREQRFIPTMQLCDNPLTPDYTEEELRELRDRERLDVAVQSTAAAFGMAIEQVRDQLAAATRIPAALLFGDPPTSLGYTARPEHWVAPFSFPETDAEYRAHVRAMTTPRRLSDAEISALCSDGLRDFLGVSPEDPK